MALDIHVAEHVAELVIDNPPVNALDSAGWHDFAAKLTELGKRATAATPASRGRSPASAGCSSTPAT